MKHSSNMFQRRSYEINSSSQNGFIQSRENVINQNFFFLIFPKLRLKHAQAAIAHTDLNQIQRNSLFIQAKGIKT